MLTLLTGERLLDEMLVEQQANAAASEASSATVAAAVAATAGAAGGVAAEAEAEALVQKGLELVHGVYGVFFACVCAVTRPRLATGGHACVVQPSTNQHEINPHNAPKQIILPNTTQPKHQTQTADIYEAFHARWLAADPPNVMSFPMIFDALKRDTRRRLRAARGDWALLAFLP